MSHFYLRSKIKKKNNDKLKIKKSRIANSSCQFVLLLIAAVDQIKVFLPFVTL